MRRRHSPPKHEVLLIVIYFILLAVFYYLNFGNGRVPDIKNLIICGVQFLITGIIFSAAVFIYFRRTNKMVTDLHRVSDEIRSNKVTDYSEISFQSKLVSQAFNNYQEEIKRLKKISDGRTICDIEDYINDDLVDESINKGLMSLVPGTMTGLGILGTFIGLTLGLQFFNTGSAEEITNSIAPLMDGIKVAFHTSIYGMLFSLVFNYVYKKKLGSAYVAVEGFLSAFSNKISPKPENELMSRQVEYQDYQMQMTEQLAENIGDVLGQKLESILLPQFEEMNKTIERFAMTASQTQVEGVQEMVSKFVKEMNSSLGDNFKELGVVLADTCALQREQSSQIHEILEKTDSMVNHLLTINELTKSTVEEMNGYVNRMEELQASVNRNMEVVQEQTQLNNAMLAEHQRYLDELTQYEHNLTQAAENLVEKVGLQLAELQSLEKAISDSVLDYTDKLDKKISDSLSTIKQMEMDIQTSSKEGIAEIHSAVKEQCRILTESAKKNIEEIVNLKGQTSAELKRTSSDLEAVLAKLNGELQNVLNKTFDSFDINLQEITHHLSGTIAQVESTTDNVPKIVEAAYEGLDKSFEKMQLRINELVSQVEELERITEARINLVKDEY